MTPQQQENPQEKPQDLLGAPAPSDDWKLEPGVHASKLKAAAAPLKRVLEHSVIQEIMRRYDRHDEAAIGHQSVYKRYGRTEIYLGAAAAILGAVVLSMKAAEDVEPVYELVRVGLLIIQIVCAAGVVAVKFFLQQSKPFVKWQEARSLAETARIELFDTVCGLTGRKWEDEQKQDQKPGEFPLLPLQLEYFVRYQMMVQLTFYDKRGKQHQAAANRYVGFGAIVTFVVALSASLLGFVEDFGDAVSIAAMAALAGPILLGAQTSLSRLNQDERNAARYAITHGHLERHRARLSDVRSDAASGNSESVHGFIRDVDADLSVEHSQWRVQQSETEASEASE